jgi:hypothetical protein
MITYKTEISNLDWEKLVDLYDETDMCSSVQQGMKGDITPIYHTLSFF